jgi:predicted enzyme related to lactoylglutathione lyase
MSKAPVPVRARFVWHELMTTDIKSAAAFFGKVVGWKTQSDQKSSYTMFVIDKRPMAGLMLLPEDAKAMGARPNWLSYIGTPDVDATAREAAALGATIVKPPTDIPNVGRFAVIADPQGAVFAGFTPLPTQTPPADGTPAVGDFSWHELATSDWRAAFDFYQRLFGWEKTESMDMGPEVGTYQMYGWKGKTLGGMFNKSKNMPGPPAWLPYIKVTDTKQAVKKVATLGGQVVSGPMEVPGGDWIAQGIDLQGAMFAIDSSKPVASKPAAKKPARSAKKRPAKKTARKAKPTKRTAGKRRSKKKIVSKKTRR